ncbi:MAG TPA: hypothetical protein ENL21_04295 [Caldithrix abyssi]|uniref:Chemotaxis protein CheZ n=1 Tax=Caldithrix abyssi TaxID=187145 RepID=A0A7V5H5Q9_CALAY|nr:hypothetical protein [Caldithrix abyssi]
MDKVNGIGGLIKKIEGLQLSIKINDDTKPVINDLFQFIKDIIPLMLEVNAFSKEGTNKVPSATDNLNKVSKTTEMAAQEVMDHLENIIGELDELKSIITDCNLTKAVVRKIEIVQDKVQNVFYSFQFQDITNQQLEYVNRILNAIYQKFVDLFDSSLRIKGNTIFGKGLMDAIQAEMNKEKSTSFNKQTTEIVRQNTVTQEAIDKYFK